MVWLPLIVLGVAVVISPLRAVAEPGTSTVRGTLAYDVIGLQSNRSRIEITDFGATVRRVATPSSAKDWGPAVSPSGREVAFLRGGSRRGVYVTPAAGGSDRRVAGPRPGFTFTVPVWSRNARQIVSGASVCNWRRAVLPKYLITDVATARSRTVAALDSPAKVEVGEPAWSPDGRRLLYIVYYGDPPEPGEGDQCRFSGPTPSALYVSGSDGRGRRLLTRNDSGLGAPTWSPTGRQIAYVDCSDAEASGCEVYVSRADGESRRIVFRDVPALADVGWLSEREALVLTYRAIFLVDVRTRARTTLASWIQVSYPGRILATSATADRVAVHTGTYSEEPGARVVVVTRTKTVLAEITVPADAGADDSVGHVSAWIR